MSWTARDVVVAAAIAFVVAAAMEPWARLLHGRVWHHALWPVHKSHHEARLGRFEKNDALSALHAPIAAVLIVIGCQLHGLLRAVCIGIGAGMTLFGIAYMLVHDGLVHERLPMGGLLRWRFFRRIRGAHRAHHKTGGPPFGLFLGPRELMQRRREGAPRAEDPTAPSAPARARQTPRDTRLDVASRSNARSG